MKPLKTILFFALAVGALFGAPEHKKMTLIIAARGTTEPTKFILSPTYAPLLVATGEKTGAVKPGDALLCVLVEQEVPNVKNLVAPDGLPISEIVEQSFDCGPDGTYHVRAILWDTSKRYSLR